MFPRLRQQILARVDLLVELSTLGEYGVDERGAVMALDPEPAAAPLAARRRDRCGGAGSQAAVCAMARDRAVPARP
jgi:hypothetical protein